MHIVVRQLHPIFVGEVSGVDAGRPLAAAVVNEISAAIDRYAVLVFRGQDLDDERQLRPEVSDISNLDENNRLRAADDPRRVDQLGKRLWHTDGSFRRVPAAL